MVPMSGVGGGFGANIGFPNPFDAVVGGSTEFPTSVPICGFCVAGGGTGGGPLLILGGAGLVEPTDVTFPESFSTMLDLNPVAFSLGIPPENNPPRLGGPPTAIAVAALPRAGAPGPTELAPSSLTFPKSICRLVKFLLRLSFCLCLKNLNKNTF